jgi:hypothetical protein
MQRLTGQQYPPSQQYAIKNCKHNAVPAIEPKFITSAAMQIWHPCASRLLIASQSGTDSLPMQLYRSTATPAIAPARIRLDLEEAGPDAAASLNAATHVSLALWHRLTDARQWR